MRVTRHAAARNVSRHHERHEHRCGDGEKNHPARSAGIRGRLARSRTAGSARSIHGAQFTRHCVSMSRRIVSEAVGPYTDTMPRLWTASVEDHRRDVRGSILDATGALVRTRGLHAVTMSEIAEQAGIGRATLYKYFADLDAVLTAWHERRIGDHLERLIAISGRAGTVLERLTGVIEAFALTSYERREHHGTEVAAMLHSGEHVTRAHRKLRELLRDLIAQAAIAGGVRDDVPPDELAGYCLHALAAAGDLTSKNAVRRVVGLTLSALQVRSET
jgi:AcrR family transcriptional regulator